MSDEQSKLPTWENSESRAIDRPDQEGKGIIQAALPEAERIRAARAKLIEETTYRLTDLFTIVSARIELLSDKAPTALREELAAIRKVVLHGVELNKRLFQVAQACRLAIELPKQPVAKPTSSARNGDLP